MKSGRLWTLTALLIAGAMLCAGCMGGTVMNSVKEVIAETVTKEQAAELEKSAASTIEGPLAAGEDGYLEGYVLLAEKSFLLRIRTLGYVGQNAFSEYLANDLRYNEIMIPACEAVQIEIQIQNYAGSALPEIDDLFDLRVLRGQKLGESYIGNHYAYDGFADEVFEEENISRIWLMMPGAAEDATALKITTTDETGMQHDVYLALPTSDPTMLPTEVRHVEPIEAGAQGVNFTLRGISTTRKIYTWLRGYSTRYSDNGERLLDVVLDYTGPSAELFGGTFLGIFTLNDVVYAFHALYMETADGTELKETGTTGDEGAVIHMVCRIPDGEEGTGNILFCVGDNRYELDYTVGERIGNFSQIALKEELTQDGAATLKLTKEYVKTKVKPRRTGGDYSYFEVKDKESTFAVLEFELTNLADQPVYLDQICGATACIDGQEYLGYVTRESSNGRKVNAPESVEAGKTARGFAIIQIPLTEAENEIRFTLSVYGMNYEYLAPAA